MTTRMDSPQHTVLAAAIAIAIAIALAGCATNNPAPIVDRTARANPPVQQLPQTQPRSLPPAPLPATPYPGTSAIEAQPVGSGVTIGTVPPPVVYERSVPPSGSPLPPPVTANVSPTSALPPPLSIPPSPPPVNSLPPTSAMPGNTAGSVFHVVQRGETLYRIAVNNGLTVDSLANWNGLSSVAPNLREGQVIRLRPPEQTGPITAPGVGGEPRPLPPAINSGAPLVIQPDGTTLPSTPVPSSAPLRTDPRGQRVPYSDSALAQMQRNDPNPVVSSTTAPSGSIAPPPLGGRVAEGAPGAIVPPVVSADAEFRPGNGVERDGVTWTWPTTGRVGSKWSDKAAMKGIDLAAKAGTPVVSAAAGKVIYVGKEPRGTTQMIVVSHANETLSVYYHTDKVLVKEQQRVTLGQKIAEVSDASGNKMHFEVRKQGRPLDPLPLMPAR